MKIGTGFLSDREKQIFINILFQYEGTITFDDSEMGLLDPAIESSVIIYMVPHVPWQQRSILLPKSMQQVATQYVKEKLANEMLEFSEGPYRCHYFLVMKRNRGEFRSINDVQLLN